VNILYICTHNRCRSVLCEAITNHLSDGQIQAFSAGSEPAGIIHSATLRHLQNRGISTDKLRSQSWDDFEDISLDAVITVCDQAASESCPIWFGDCVKAHWGLPDPSRVQGSTELIDSAFDAVIATITAKTEKLLQLERSTLTDEQLAEQLNKIAEDH